jgi:adenosine deaminase
VSTPYSGIRAKVHCHLDGSAPLLTELPNMWRLTYGSKKPYRLNQWQNHQEQINKWFGNPLKGNIVQKFSLTTGLMQDVDTLFLAAKRYVECRARQGLLYCEAIIAPQYHTFMGLSIRQVIEALIRGIKRGEREYPEIEVNLLLGIGREISEEEAIELVVAFGQCDRDYCVGVTLVCDEAKHPPEKHKKSLRLAKLSGFKIACHAGEWVHNPDTQEPDLYRDMHLLLKNCWTAAKDIGVDRLEHARPLAYDQNLLKFVIDNGIGVSSCPGSYICTELIDTDGIKTLRLNELLDSGVALTIDSDDDLFMPNLDEVIDICNQKLRFTESQMTKLRTSPWKMRFGNRKPVPADVAALL